MIYRTLTAYRGKPIILGKRQWKSHKCEKMIGLFLIVALILLIWLMGEPEVNNADFIGNAEQWEELLAEKGS